MSKPHDFRTASRPAYDRRLCGTYGATQLVPMSRLYVYCTRTEPRLRGTIRHRPLRWVRRQCPHVPGKRLRRPARATQIPALRSVREPRASDTAEAGRLLIWGRGPRHHVAATACSVLNNAVQFCAVSGAWWARPAQDHASIPGRPRRRTAAGVSYAFRLRYNRKAGAMVASPFCTLFWGGTA